TSHPSNPAIHSFPTRRSSDLGEGVLALQPQDAGDRLVLGQEVGELRDPALVAELLLAHLRTAQVADDQLQTGDDERRLLGPPEEDRKSTRLNSSHSQISYAVF